jgi:O-antigen/teichoic acid export membrane protein
VSPPHHPEWAADRDGALVTVARNLSTRYLVLLLETIVGLVMLPFNLSHLGPSHYGLWILIGGVTAHFSLLDLGYGGATVKFVAQYRAHRNARALNEIASTLFFIFAGVGLLAYAAAAVLAFNLDHVFRLTPEQAQLGKWILLVIALQVAVNFPFSVFGGITSGFQRYDMNNVVAMTTSLTVAAVNVGILLAGYGLLTLVCAATAVRLVAYLAYRLNAYRVFPELRIRPSLFCRRRLREVTGFSVYSAAIDWANKLNYQIDGLIAGAFLGSAAVSTWAVAERVIWATQRLTNQLNGVVFPLIVDRDQRARREQLQQILVQGTRLSLLMVLPLAVVLVMLAEPIVVAWVGPAMAGSAPIIQILAFAVAIRVGNASGTTMLKGAGEHRRLAAINLATGVVNVALSVALIGRYGLIGVAIGTLIPIAFSSIVLLYPAACRLVGLPLRRAVREAIFPALWPAFASAAVLTALPDISSGTVLAVVAHAAAAGLTYVLLFFGAAIGGEDRRMYLGHLQRVVRRTFRRDSGPQPSLAA